MADSSAPAGLLSGFLAWRLVLVAALAVIVVGVLSGWLVSRAAGHEALRRLAGQQSEEVEVVARLLASKIEQSQKVLRQVATGITPEMLDSPSSLEWLLQQGLPAVQFFDSMQVARQDGQLYVNLQYGRLDSAANLDPAERDGLRRTLVDGKPMVSELIAGRTSDARVMFTQPLHREDGAVMGVVAGELKLQSQGLLPGSLLLPQRAGSRLVVFTRDGTILLHSDPARVMGQVRDEPGLAQAYAQRAAQEGAVEGRGSTQILPGHIVSMAGMPLPQWMVARVSDAQAVLAPLHGAQHQAWWLAATGMALGAVAVALLLWWLVRPLAQLRERAVLLLDPQSPRDLPWPTSGAEVGALVQVFRGLEQRYGQQQAQHATLVGQFEAVMEHASVSIVILRDGVLQVVGHQACRMLGYSADELRGRPARDIYLSDTDYADTAARVKAGLATHGALMGDVRLRRKDGSPVWVRVQGRSVCAHGQDSGVTVWTLEDLTALHAAREQNVWLATHDPLTQLSNRQGCERRLQLLLAERLARRQGEAPADSADSADSAGCDGVFLYLDLDHFTVVNLAAGHDAGDDVLCHVAQLLQAQVGQGGWVARLGGDEYGVVLPGCTPAHGLVVAEQLRAVVQAWEPVYQGRSFTLGVSMGMVVLDARTQDVSAVLQAGDMACYDAKRAGRNQVVQHTPLPCQSM
ncbi:MAG: diguanylate cyclase [Simplicispira sp.]|nr:diguanylate cyclase [Simplicispira sp.]